MKSGDGMTNIAYYCFHKIKLLPSEFNALPLREKAMVIAFIQERIESEKKEMSKMKKSRR